MLTDDHCQLKAEQKDLGKTSESSRNGHVDSLVLQSQELKPGFAFTSALLRFFLYQILRGMKYVHSAQACRHVSVHVSMYLFDHRLLGPYGSSFR